MELSQRHAWQVEIVVLQQALTRFAKRGSLLFEFVLPRLGRRIDVVLLLDDAIFILEFKVGERAFTRHGLDQAWDYALDLKNFHQPSHQATLVPLLCAPSVRSASLIGSSASSTWKRPALEASWRN